LRHWLKLKKELEPEGQVVCFDFASHKIKTRKKTLCDLCASAVKVSSASSWRKTTRHKTKFQGQRRKDKSKRIKAEGSRFKRFCWTERPVLRLAWLVWGFSRLQKSNDLISIVE